MSDILFVFVQNVNIPPCCIEYANKRNVCIGRGRTRERSWKMVIVSTSNENEIGIIKKTSIVSFSFTCSLYVIKSSFSDVFVGRKRILIPLRFFR